MTRTSSTGLSDSISQLTVQFSVLFPGGVTSQFDNKRIANFMEICVWSGNKALSGF